MSKVLQRYEIRDQNKIKKPTFLIFFLLDYMIQVEAHNKWMGEITRCMANHLLLQQLLKKMTRDQYNENNLKWREFYSNLTELMTVKLNLKMRNNEWEFHC
jgi:hypothetical protein